MLKLRSRNAYINVLSTCGLQLCLRLCNIHVRGDAAVIAGLGELQRFFKVDDCRIQQLLLQIQPAQGEVVERKFRVKAQADIFEIACACLRVLAAGFYGSP